MRVISKRGLEQLIGKHADAREAAEKWYIAAIKADWHSLEDIRKTYRSADQVGSVLVFNLRGNHYRLIVRASFRRQVLYVKELLTHAEYDKGDWKKWLK